LLRQIRRFENLTHPSNPPRQTCRSRSARRRADRESLSEAGASEDPPRPSHPESKSSPHDRGIQGGSAPSRNKPRMINACTSGYTPRRKYR
jgi:hypothetical protein